MHTKCISSRSIIEIKSYWAWLGDRLRTPLVVYTTFYCFYCLFLGKLSRSLKQQTYGMEYVLGLVFKCMHNFIEIFSIFINIFYEMWWRRYNARNVDPIYHITLITRCFLSIKYANHQPNQPTIVITKLLLSHFLSNLFAHFYLYLS